MSRTPNLDLPFIEAAQAQKHVTHNEALRRLDAMVQVSVRDRDLSAPPAEPQEGDRYIVGAGATGDWEGRENAIAAWLDGAWEVFDPQEGWLAWAADEHMLLVWDGAAWVAFLEAVDGAGGAIATLGVNAAADETNRLAVASPAVLFDHEGADLRLKVNKAAAGDTGSLLFQTGYAGRAEMGLAGDDDFRVKVSADGATWREALVVDRATGAVTLPNTAPAADARATVLLAMAFA